MKRSIVSIVLILLVAACSNATALPSPQPFTATLSAVPTFTPTATPPPPVSSGFPDAPVLNEELPTDGLVMAMHRYGDNTCYDVGVYQDDSYLVISCLADYEYAVPAGTLDQHASSYLHHWIGRYQGFEIASAQGLLKFSGNGSLASDDAVQISMETLLTELELLGHDYAVPFDGLPRTALAAGHLLEKRLGMVLGTEAIRLIEQVEFSDSCLDLPRPDEICAQVITPGMKIGIVVGELMYVLHTDVRGFDLRLNADPLPAPPRG